MLKRHHQIVAIATTTTINSLVFNVTIPNLIISAFVSFICCNLPDIDLNLKSLKHRGLTHTIWAWLLFTAILSITQSPIIITTGSIAYLSHILIDNASIAGVRLLAPFTNNKQDSKYGIFIKYNKNGTICHHHLNYKGYRVGGKLETAISSGFLFYYIVILIYLIKPIIS